MATMHRISYDYIVTHTSIVQKTLLVFCCQLCNRIRSYLLQICRVTVAYGCLEMAIAACGSLRLPNLAIVYLVAHYTQIEHSVSSASNHYMTDTCGCAQQYSYDTSYKSLVLTHV
jgi:hypothetical protein